MRLLVGFLILIIAQGSFANLGGSRSNAHEDYTESWFITFGGAFTTRVISHNESSSDSNFVSLGEEARVSDLRISLGISKEFMQQDTISFTFGLFGGISNGSFKSGEQNQTDFEEKLQSVHFGGGLSVNYNLYLWGYKVQPFLGLDIIQETGELNAQYDSSGNTTVLTHEFQDQVMLPGLGIRAFDDEVSLMSYFKLSMPQYMSDSFEAKAVINGADVPVNSISEFYRAPAAIELGFGYFF